MWILIALAILTVSIQADKVSTKVQTDQLINKIHKASFVPDFATRAALNFFQKSSQNDPTNSTTNSSSETNTTQNIVTPNNQTIVEDDNDYSFWGGFTASLAMICFAEFGDRVFF